MERPVGVSWDISGEGICGAAGINFTKGWAWTQHPAPLEIHQVYTVPLGFKGKNAIAWLDDTFVGFVVGDILVENGGTLIKHGEIKNATDNKLLKELPLQGVCHFTLDDESTTNIQAGQTFGANYLSP